MLNSVIGMTDSRTKISSLDYVLYQLATLPHILRTEQMKSRKMKILRRFCFTDGEGRMSIHPKVLNAATDAIHQK